MRFEPQEEGKDVYKRQVKRTLGKGRHHRAERADIVEIGTHEVAVMTTFTKGALNCGQVRGPVQDVYKRQLVQKLVERLDRASPADDDGQHGDSRFHKRILLCQNKIIPSAVQQKGWKQQMTTQQGLSLIHISWTPQENARGSAP